MTPTLSPTLLMVLGSFILLTSAGVGQYALIRRPRIGLLRAALGVAVVLTGLVAFTIGLQDLCPDRLDFMTGKACLMIMALLVVDLVNKVVPPRPTVVEAVVEG